MEKLCDKCKKEECPRCNERSKENQAWLSNLVSGAVLFWFAVKLSYRVGVANGREENSADDQKEV